MAAPTLDWAPPEAATAQPPQPDTWQPPEATASWAPPEAQQTETNWQPPEAQDKPFFNLADTASAIVDFGRGIVNTTPAALSTLSEGLTRPDKWSEDTLKNLEQDEAF